MLRLKKYLVGINLPSPLHNFRTFFLDIFSDVIILSPIKLENITKIQHAKNGRDDISPFFILKFIRSHMIT